MPDNKQMRLNPDSGKLHDICCRERWFTCGSLRQYDKLWHLNRIGAPLDELALMIWACSDYETETYTEDMTNIKAILKEAGWTE